MLLTLSALESKTGRGVRVAVIDSGVHAGHPHVQGVWGGAGIDDDGHEHDDFVDRLGHGTAVAAAIREKAPDAELFAIKVFARDLRATGAALVAALRRARAASSRIANLSLGTANPAHELDFAREVTDAHAAGMLVVAAGPQGETRWLPGALPGVIAVTMDMRVPRDACEIAVINGAIAVSACGYPRPIPGVPPERNLQGISFAVANASGMLARLLEGTSPGATIANLLSQTQK